MVEKWNVAAYRGRVEKWLVGVEYGAAQFSATRKVDTRAVRSMLHCDMKPLSAEPESQTGAFTLLELLVVISIIAVLAALILSALSRTKQTVGAATCSNNLRQLGVAFVLYSENNNDSFPASGSKSI
jgi:prepilin-type N-terminal cleavage/methylation domain-containing protein